MGKGSSDHVIWQGDTGYGKVCGYENKKSVPSCAIRALAWHIHHANVNLMWCGSSMQENPQIIRPSCFMKNRARKDESWQSSQQSPRMWKKSVNKFTWKNRNLSRRITLNQKKMQQLTVRRSRPVGNQALVGYVHQLHGGRVVHGKVYRALEFGGWCYFDAQGGESTGTSHKDCINRRRKDYVDKV
jgi:hypothetical protein